MSTYTYNKSGSADPKSNTLGSVSRQNVIQETNKRRGLLKDSSWIKTRPEDEEDKMREENYGKSILNRYKSQDNLDKDNDKDEKASIHNRFKSDDALDRISLRNTSERGNKSATLERMPMSESDPVNKRQSWAPSNKTTTTTTTTTTEESKRKSWGPTSRNTTITTTTETKPAIPSKPDGQKITIYSSDTRTTDKPTRTNFIDSARSRFEKAEEKPSPPTSPPARIESRPAYPAKPVTAESGERRSAVDRKQRSQDLDNLIGVSSSRVVKSKGSQDLDNLIEVSNPKVVSSQGTQNVDNLIDIKSTIDKGVKSRAQNMDNLIDIKPTANKGVKSDQLDGLIEISDTAKNTRKREDQLNDFIDIKKPEAKARTQNLDNLIEIKNTNTASTNKGTQNLDNLIDIKNTNTISTNKGTQNFDNLIEIKNTNTASTNKGTQNFDNLIEIKKTNTANTNKGTQNFDNLIEIKKTNTANTNKGNQDLDDLIGIAGEINKGTTKYPANSSNTTSRSSTTTTTYNVTSDNSDAPSRRSTTTRTYNVTNDSQDSPFRGSTTTTTYKLSDDNSEAPSRRPTTTTTTTTYKDISDAPSTRSNVTYTQDSWKPSPNTYGESIVSNSIKTVYSTSDRSVIEKDLCTYCRKPLGIDAKMILKDLSICCHATCFKCEACSGSLGNLKAGDSMWIYKQTIHCEPCYFSAREKWII